MLTDTNHENIHENDVSSNTMKINNKDSNISSEKELTFKDWKTLKGSQNKTNEKKQNNYNVKSKINYNGCIEYRNNCNINGSRVPIVQEAPNVFGGNIGPTGFWLPNNFSGVNYNTNYGMRSINKAFNNFNGPNNNFNRQNNFAGNFNNRFNNCSGSNNFTNSNGLNSFGSVYNRVSGRNEGNLPNSFFTSDGIYRQKDLMQKPLPNQNPFRNEQKANQLLQEFDISRYSKCDKKKKVNKKVTQVRKPISTPKEQQAVPDYTKKLYNEPKVYVPNPKAKIDGKPYIPKPKIPDQNFEISKEEKKKQWKEYREAMKPFRNKEFYNARRVVQRLGKKAPCELDEKQLIRLTNAREIMAVYKARLSAKYANYIKDEGNSNELGELYVLKRNPLKYSDSGMQTTKQFQNYGNFGESQPYNDTEAGAKIVGGSTEFKGFIPGGLLAHASQ